MDLLEKIRKTAGAQAAMGFSPSKNVAGTAIPEGCSLIACSESVLFCHIEGYLDTVFAIMPEQGNAPVPLAYSLQDFIRLILSCGSAQAAADGMVLGGQREKMQKLARILNLTLIPDPVAYLKTVPQVIDCSRILLKKQA